MRWKCVCAYDGTPFVGWQRQTRGGSIQDAFEMRLAEIFKKPVCVHGSGRTDAGVHARGQVFHFDAEWSYGPEVLRRALVSGLRSELQILSLQGVADSFHARYSATGKRYAYNLFLGYASPFDTRYTWSLGVPELDIVSMNRVAEQLLGKHDFSTFGGSRRDGSVEDPVKDVRMLRFSQEGSRVCMVTEASGYLYKMVRMLVGSLVNVGLGKLSGDTLLDLWKDGKRVALIETAPAQGLFLEKVYYDE
jgi:tRNA pseudouridine38-40 synthase